MTQTAVLNAVRTRTLATTRLPTSCIYHQLNDFDHLLQEVGAIAKRLLLRDAENVSADMLQRILGSLYAGLPAIGGVGTGYSTGSVGTKPTASTGHLAVTANGSTLQLTILPGWASVVRDAGGSTYDPRTFFAESDANDTSVTLTANATGSTRNDTVCLKLDQNAAPTSDGSNLPSFVAIAGQSGGGVSNAPADGNLYLPIANVAVANGATSVAQGNVTDLRQIGVAPGTGLLAFKPQQSLATPADPVGTTSLTGVMLGLAGSITPQSTGRVLIVITGDVANSTASDGSDFQIRYGTGTAPTNGAALTGSTAGSKNRLTNNASTANAAFPCAVAAIATGLVTGTAYWIDLSLAAVTGGTASLGKVAISVVEI